MPLPHYSIDGRNLVIAAARGKDLKSPPAEFPAFALPGHAQH